MVKLMDDFAAQGKNWQVDRHDDVTGQRGRCE
jgi:hypothetical protein